MTTAVYLDTENIRYSCLNLWHEEPDYAALLQLSIRDSDRYTARAFLDPDQHPQRVKNAIEAAGFDIIYTPTKVASGKKSSKADMYIAMDVLESVFENPSTQEIVLCSGDGDFAKLVSKLVHKYQKIVRIIAVTGSLSALLEQTGVEITQIGNHTSTSVAQAQPAGAPS